MADELRNWTKGLALQNIRLVESLPASRTANILGGQLLRSGTSVGANYEPPVARGRGQSSLLNWVLSKKKQTNRSIGWNYLLSRHPAPG